MGNLFSQETNNVIVKIKPYFFTINEDGYSQDKIKNFNRKNIYLSQTPQLFKYKILLNLFYMMS